ncbi:MAG TPA: AAA family ATPase [Solirubrobacteraceae bacterium]|nr:AAA family ATPase [Solirubrobacteraceae bacterium]
MRELVPQFLLERLAEHRDHGRMDGAAVFVDLVGFTAMGDALARHGPHGAEIVADIVQSAMIPIVNAVHREGGFVAAFPGDAVLAVFPSARTQPALAAAEAIRDAVRAIGRRETAYGSFDVAARVGVGAGDLRWGVLRASERRTYFVGGTAPAHAISAEGAASPGEVVVHESVARASLTPSRLCECPPASVLESLATGFVDPDLLDTLGAGEFRPVTPAFVGIPLQDLHRVIADVFDLQDRHGGHLDPVEIGDKGCVLRLLWGAPVRYEGDDERALRFLDELRRRHPAARAGVTLGTAFAGFVGTAERKGFITYGSHVNLAARLMSTAAPGEVLVSRELAVRTSFVFRAAGAHTLKGFSEPVEVEALVEARSPARSPHRAAGGFVGRARELAALDGFLASPRGAAVVRGPAGIGKSALVAEARRRVGGRVRWLAAAADPVSRGALQPLRSVALDVLGNERRLDATVSILRLEAHRGYLRALVGLPDSGYEQAEPRARARGMLDALVALFRALSSQRPLVLELDDLHWSDLETLAFLPELLSALADRPFALVATTREPESLADVTLDLALGELASDDLGALGMTVLDEALAPETCAWLEERTQCNPFFAQQVLLHMRECGHLVPSVDGLRLTAAGEAVPPTVDAVIVARLDGLPSDLRRVVRCAAVLGVRADEEELTRLLARDGAPVDDLPRLISVAGAHGVWTRVDRTLVFAHALVRDAVYGTLLLARRRELHAAAADVIEALHADLGPHLHRLANHHAGAGANDRARACERLAADRALGLGAYLEAGQYAESGLAMGAAADGEELGLWLALAASRMITHGQGAPETKAAYDHAAALSDEAEDTREGFRALFGLRTFYLFQGDHPRSLEMAQRSLAIAERIGAPDILQQAHLMLGNAYFWMGELDAADRHLELAQEQPAAHGTHLAGFAQDPRFTVVFPAAMSRWLRGDARGALGVAQRALDDAVKLGDRFCEAMMLQVVGFLHCLDGRGDAAFETATRLVALAREDGFPVYVGIGSMQLGWAQARLGDVDAGLQLMHDTLARMRAGGTQVGGTLMGALIADACLAAGRVDPGLAAASDALADGRRRGELAFVGLLERLAATQKQETVP